MIVNQQSISGLYNAFNAVFRKAFDAAKPEYEIFVMPVSSKTEKETYPWLGQLPSMREWVGERVVKGISAHAFTIINKDYESTISLPRNAVDDNTYGMFNTVVQDLAYNAAQHPGMLVLELLSQAWTTTCYDGQYMVDTDHPVGEDSVSNNGGGSGTPWFLMDLSRPLKPIILQKRQTPRFVALDKETDKNVFFSKELIYGVDDRKNVGWGMWQLVYGSKQTLDADSYFAAKVAMRNFANEEGKKLGIKPTHLVVPGELESTAKDLIKIERLASGATNKWYNDTNLLVVDISV